MCNSSTASTTAPLAWARSTSRIRAACIRAAVAACRDVSSWRAIWWRTTANSPAPSNPRMTVKIPAYQNVRRSRSRPSSLTGIGSRAEAVARPAQRGDQLGLEAIVDFPAQPTHQHLEDIDEGVVVVVPHVRRDGRAIEHLAGVQHEQLEQGERLGAERDRSPIAAHRA